MPMEMTMDQFERVESLLTNIRDEQAESRIETALQRQELGQIRQHLALLNGRTGKSEERLQAIEYAAIEARGAKKAIIAGVSGAASVLGGLVSWAVSKFLP
jgi:hypothetical protein